MKNEITASFLLTGFRESPEEVTGRLGIQPTETWKEGEPIARTIRRHTENGWLVASGIDSSADLRVHIERLLELIRPAKNLISTLAPCEAEINITIHANEYSPECHFQKEWLREICELGAEIDIDFYYP